MWWNVCWDCVLEGPKPRALECKAEELNLGWETRGHLSGVCRKVTCTQFPEAGVYVCGRGLSPCGKVLWAIQALELRGSRLKGPGLQKGMGWEGSWAAISKA